MQAVDMGIDRIKGQRDYIEETQIFGLTKSDKDKIAELDKSIAILEGLRVNRAKALDNRTAPQNLPVVPLPVAQERMPVVTQTEKPPATTQSRATPPNDAYPASAKADMDKQNAILSEIRDSLQQTTSPAAGNPVNHIARPSAAAIRRQAMMAGRPNGG
jgi:hypothetical protein